MFSNYVNKGRGTASLNDLNIDPPGLVDRKRTRSAAECIRICYVDNSLYVVWNVSVGNDWRIRV